ncbi:MAG: acetyltransferase [Thermoanaerobaculia bacterium]|nr:acetyltransferase [Thermoanaerobaculia bacterium]
MNEASTRSPAPIAPCALYGVESSFTAEFVETLARLGYAVAVAIQTGEPEWDLDGLTPIAVAALSPAQLALPAAVPWVTPGLKWAKVAAALELGFATFPCLIDPAASRARTAELAAGVFLNAGATVGAYAVLAEFALLNRNASVGHHTRIGAYVSLGPGATVAARCRVGRGTMLGAGAVVAPGVAIGANCLIAAGSVVTEDVPDNVKVAGNPGRVVQTGFLGYKQVAVP